MRWTGRRPCACATLTVTGASRHGIWGTKVIARNVISSGNGVDAPGDGIVGACRRQGAQPRRERQQRRGHQRLGGNVVLRDSQVTGNALGGVYGFGSPAAR